MFRINKNIFKKQNYQFPFPSFRLHRKDLKVYTFCVLGATALWFLNALNKERNEIIKYPIQFVYNHNDYILLEELPKEVAISVSGSGWQLLKKSLRIQAKPVRYRIPNPEKSPYYLTGSSLTNSFNKVLEDITLRNILVDTIKINLDKIQNRVVSIKIEPYQIPLAEGHRIVGDIKYSPKKIAFRGPQRAIEALPDPFIIEVLSNKLLNKRYRKKIPVVFKHAYQDLLEQDQEHIQVDFEVEKYLKRNIPINLQLRNLPPDSPFYLNQQNRVAQVSFKFRESDAGKILVRDFSLVADFKTFNPKDSTLRISLQKKPKYIQKADISFPNRVKLSCNE